MTSIRDFHFQPRKHKKASILQQLETNFTLYITHSQMMKAPIEGSDGSFGFSMDTGDWNGDGNIDIAISAPWDKAGTVVIKWGPLPLTYLNSNMLSVRTTILAYADPNLQLFGYVVKNACDLNGDGLDDLIITSPDKDGIVFYLYGSKSLPAKFDFINVTRDKGGIIHGMPGSLQGFGWAIASCHDFDNDKRADFIASAISSSQRSFGANTVYIATKVYNYQLHTSVTALSNITSTENNDFGFALEISNSIKPEGTLHIIASALKENGGDGALYVIPIKNISTQVNLYSPEVWHISAPSESWIELGYLLSVDRGKMAASSIKYHNEDGAVFIINFADFGQELNFSKLVTYTGIPDSAGRFGDAISFNEYGICIGMYYLNFYSGGLACFFREESTNVLGLRGDNGFVISGNQLGMSHFGLSLLTSTSLVNDHGQTLFVGAPSLYNWDGALSVIPPGCCYKELTGFCLPRLDGKLISSNGIEIHLQCLTQTVTESASETDSLSSSDNISVTYTHSISHTSTASSTKNLTESFTNTNTHSTTSSVTGTLSSTHSPTATQTRTNSPSKSATPTHFSTDSEEQTHSLTQTNTPSITLSPTSTKSYTETHTPTESHTRSSTNSLTQTSTPSHTLSPTETSSPSTYTAQPLVTLVDSKTYSASFMSTHTPSKTVSKSSYGTRTFTGERMSAPKILSLTKSIHLINITNTFKYTTTLSLSETLSTTYPFHRKDLFITPTLSDYDLDRHNVPPSHGDNSLSTSGIIGIALGITIGTLIILGGGIAVACWCYKRRSLVEVAARMGEDNPFNRIDDSPKAMSSPHSSLHSKSVLGSSSVIPTSPPHNSYAHVFSMSPPNPIEKLPPPLDTSSVISAAASVLSIGSQSPRNPLLPPKNTEEEQPDPFDNAPLAQSTSSTSSTDNDEGELLREKWGGNIKSKGANPKKAIKQQKISLPKGRHKDRADQEDKNNNDHLMDEEENKTSTVTTKKHLLKHKKEKVEPSHLLSGKNEKDNKQVVPHNPATVESDEQPPSPSTVNPTDSSIINNSNAQVSAEGRVHHHNLRRPSALEASMFDSTNEELPNNDDEEGAGGSNRRASVLSTHLFNTDLFNPSEDHMSQSLRLPPSSSSNIRNPLQPCPPRANNPLANVQNIEGRRDSVLSTHLFNFLERRLSLSSQASQAPPPPPPSNVRKPLKPPLPDQNTFDHEFPFRRPSVIAVSEQLPNFRALLDERLKNARELLSAIEDDPQGKALDMSYAKKFLEDFEASLLDETTNIAQAIDALNAFEEGLTQKLLEIIEDPLTPLSASVEHPAQLPPDNFCDANAVPSPPLPPMPPRPNSADNGRRATPPSPDEEASLPPRPGTAHVGKLKPSPAWKEILPPRAPYPPLNALNKLTPRSVGASSKHSSHLKSTNSKYCSSPFDPHTHTAGSPKHGDNREKRKVMMPMPSEPHSAGKKFPETSPKAYPASEAWSSQHSPKHSPRAVKVPVINSDGVDSEPTTSSSHDADYPAPPSPEQQTHLDAGSAEQALPPPSPPSSPLAQISLPSPATIPTLSTTSDVTSNPTVLPQSQSNFDISPLVQNQPLLQSEIPSQHSEANTENIPQAENAASDPSPPPGSLPGSADETSLPPM